jgi:hypothetical protein
VRFPDFVVNCGQDEQGKWHAFYIDPIEKCEMRGPARDTAEEAKKDGYDVLEMFTKLATENGLTVGHKTQH